MRGLSNKEIAVELSISPQTVKRHVSNVLCKAQAETRTELAYRLSDPPADGRASG